MNWSHRPPPATEATALQGQSALSPSTGSWATNTRWTAEDLIRLLLKASVAWFSLTGPESELHGRALSGLVSGFRNRLFSTIVEWALTYSGKQKEKKIAPILCSFLRLLWSVWLTNKLLPPIKVHWGSFQHQVDGTRTPEVILIRKGNINKLKMSVAAK